MKKIGFCLFLFILFHEPVAGIAQELKSSLAMPRSCLSLQEIKFSDEQEKVVKKIAHIRTEKILSLRSQHMTKSLELKALLRDPHAGEETIRSKNGETEMLQVKLQKELIDYLLEMRRVMTPDQVRAWCPLDEMPVRNGWVK
jgi:Spy/CpxP family protein refolding chaperone